MEDLVWRISNNMNPNYETEATECSILTTETTFYPIRNNKPIDTHDSTNNLPLCIYPDSFTSDMDYFSKSRIMMILGSGALPTMDTIKC